MPIDPNFDLFYDCKTEADVKNELDRLWYAAKNYNDLVEMCKTLNLTQPLNEHLRDKADAIL